MTGRSEVAEFLRACRSRVTPADVRLSADEQAHLVLLSCADPLPVGEPGTEVPTAVRINARYDVLAWNADTLRLVSIVGSERW